jgi:hypothetical protein
MDLWQFSTLINGGIPLLIAIHKFYKWNGNRLILYMKEARGTLQFLA